MADRAVVPSLRYHHHPTANIACPVVVRSGFSEVESLEASTPYHNSLPNKITHVDIGLNLPGDGREGGTFLCIRFSGGLRLLSPDGKRGRTVRPATGHAVPADHTRSLHTVAFATLIPGHHTQTCDNVGSAVPSGVVSRPVAVGRPLRVRGGRGRGRQRPGRDTLSL